MLLKIIDENRVKILMEDQDIDRYGLPFEKLNYDDPHSREFICGLIKKTYEETGINLCDSRVMVEVVPGVARSYYILISKMKQGGEEQIEFDKAELPEPQEYIFLINSGYDLVCFLGQLKGFYPQNSTLYLYNQHYYILLSYQPWAVNDIRFPDLLNHLEEYGTRCEYRLENVSFLKEYGECIVEGNAIDDFVF